MYLKPYLQSGLIRPISKFLFLLLAAALLFIAGCAPKGGVNTKPVPEDRKQADIDYINSLARAEESDNTTADSDDVVFPPAGSCYVGKYDNSDQGRIDHALALCDAAKSAWKNGDNDSAIRYLDKAYGLILQVSDKSSPTIQQQKDDLRFLISRRLLEIHSSRFTVAKGSHNAIPLVMNRYVEAEIKRFQGKEKRFFLESYRRSGLYRPMIVRELKKAGLPEELSWLPLIESGFKTKALSRARALGLWQFIPSTGYKFGLRRTVWVDDRLDPEKATAAAIAYLSELHEIFGDWSTVLAAYNCGEGAVLRAIKRQKINYLDNFWDLYQRLPMETARYVPRFLATLHIIKNPKKYGIELGQPDMPLDYETVTVNKQMNLADIAKALNVPTATLTLLNPALRYRVTPDKEYDLHVPVGMSKVLLAKLDSIKSWKPPSRYYVVHRVRKGETLSLIAKKYHTSVRAIKMSNRIRGNIIRIGQKLRVPAGRRTVPASSGSHSKRKRSLTRDGRYIVKKGDSLWDIAHSFNMSVEELKSLNGLAGTCLSVGQVLKVKSPKARSSRTSMRIYRVKPGDTLSTVAKKHNIKLSRLLKINGLSKNSMIYPGQVILLGR